MFSIKPDISIKFTCPACGSDILPENCIFYGMHTLAEVQCPGCNRELYHTYPIGHGLYFPVAFRRDGSEVFFPKRSEGWFARPLINSVISNRNRVTASIEKRTLKACQHIVILNCLDNCYGHVFLKLINAQRHIEQRRLGLIVIIPKSFLWLLPDGVAEVWSVDIPLKEGNKFLATLNAFVQKELERFETVYLSKAFTHSSNDHINFEAFTRQKKFDLSIYSSLSPHLTFVLRDDRLWLNSRLLNFMCQVTKKLRCYHFVKNFLIYFQNRSYSKLGDLIKKEFPNAIITVVGLGRQGSLSAAINDLRTTGTMTTETERKWCKIYAKSHVIVGVHGSHMLIPTSLAAGFIEILPSYKIDHVGEDITMHHNSRYMYFLGRHLQQSSGPKLVLSHIRNMLGDFSILRDNVERKY